jgi:hypothetical protein
MIDSDIFLYRLYQCLSSPFISEQEIEQINQLKAALIAEEQPSKIVDLVLELQHLVSKIEQGFHVCRIIDCHRRYNLKPLAENTPKIGTT